MRAWLIEHDSDQGSRAGLEPRLRNLAEHAADRLTLVGVSPYHTELPLLVRAGLVQVLIVCARAWPNGGQPQALFELGLPMLVVGDVRAMELWREWAQEHPIGFALSSARAEDLAAALWSLAASCRREEKSRAELHKLQQRLSDRIIIEKAKGVLIQRLGISEDDAYRQLRAQSRRQRKQVREIAQSILDTQFLLGGRSFGDLHEAAASGEPRLAREPRTA